MGVKKTGRRSLGEVIGRDARIAVDRDEQIRIYALRIGRAEAEELLRLLDAADGAAGRPNGVILAATCENWSRLRALLDPAPRYEIVAAQDYLRGDVVRVTGSKRSCNIFLSGIGAAMLQERLRAAANRMTDWVEMRARVVHRRAASQRSLVEFVPDADLRRELEATRLGRTGEALAGDVWTAEDFKDWE